MKREWIDYLTSIGFHEPFMERAEAVIAAFSTVMDVDSSFLFVGERPEQGDPVYESLWMCNEDVICKSSDFARTDAFNSYVLRGRITGLYVGASRFNWSKPNAASRLRIHIFVGGRGFQDLFASGHNCLRLSELVVKYIRPAMYAKRE